MIYYFIDPLLRGPTLASMFMCAATALIGMIVYLRGISLLGESLSHAAFPGMILGVVAATFFVGTGGSAALTTCILLFFAFLSSFLGLFVIHFLEKKIPIPKDALLSLVLSVFFGAGITLASRIQLTHASLYKTSLSYLFGQAATMTDQHILFFGILFLVTAYLIKRYFWEIKIRCFDSDYAKTIGISVYGIDLLIAFLITFAIIMGMRSVGVVLVSAMLIAPAVTARQYSDKLQTCFLLAIFFGMASGFLGNVSSFALGNYYQKIDPAARLSFSTGPMIVFCATLFCLFALLFAPKRGLFLRYMRTFFFKMSCLSENILKALWREDAKGCISFKKIQEKMAIPSLFLYILLLQLKREGWLKKEHHQYKLTKEGLMRAEQVVRLHRLWELYLVNYLGVDATRVHASAEEMEHILTPAIEKELCELLDNPVLDPHRQPIPRGAY